MMGIDFYKGTSPVLHFTVAALDGSRTLELEVRRLIHGGRTARARNVSLLDDRDREAGGRSVEPPAAVAFLVPTFNATTSSKIAMYDHENYSEAEVAILTDDDGTRYVTVGSDHTDRDLELTGGSAKSRLAAPKVMAPTAWVYDEVKGHWDELVIRSHVYRDGEPELCQEGTIGTLLPADAIFAVATRQIGLDDFRGSVLFCGTIPYVQGEAPFGHAWDLELLDPVMDRRLQHHFEVEVIWHRVPPYGSEHSDASVTAGQ
jgi:hypothetical protein